MQFLGNVIRNWGIAFEKLASLTNQKFKGRGEEGKVNAFLLPVFHVQG